MRWTSLFPASVLACGLLAAPNHAQPLPQRTFRQWIGGQEAGGASLDIRADGPGQVAVSHEWLTLSREGSAIRQDMEETVHRAPDGSLAFAWTVQLSREPFEGTATWSPQAPGVLRLVPKNGAPVTQPVPAGALLWPGDLEARYRQAARLRQPLLAVTYSFPLQQWSTVALQPQGPDPRPGFPDAIHFRGQETDGTVRSPLESWISPVAGEVRQTGMLGALPFLVQRAELPVPAQAPATTGFFERTLQPLAPNPFLPWLPEVILRATGGTASLPEDAQQQRLPDGRWRLRRPQPPTPAEAAEAPVTGTPAALDAPYLAASPLVPFRDPAFDGLLRRMALPPGLSRWQLTQRVMDFVFDWITEKDYSVGFASALEVCHHPAGDCTEHGVLAVALLRRLGVPSRGVVGWVAVDGLIGLHFWVEVKLADRWVPVDPTFDQAPASAFRIKLADSDLADLGSVGWDSAATALQGLVWRPESWEAGIRIAGDQVTAPDGSRLRVPGGRWRLAGGILTLTTAHGGPWAVEATTRPDPSDRVGAHHLAGARTQQKGWWSPASRALWVELPQGRWLLVSGVSESESFLLLDQLEVTTARSGN